jgi:Protein of unknown function (DUF2442)
MATSPVELDATAVEVLADEETLRVTLADAREIAVPLMWFPRLLAATPQQRTKWRLIGRGIGIAWDELDEHISVAGLLRQH